MRVCGPSALICARLRRLDFRRLLPFCCPDAARSSRRHSRAVGHASMASPEHLASGSRRGRRPLRVVAAASGESTLAHATLVVRDLRDFLPEAAVNKPRLKDRVALVTGASRGGGKGIALVLGEERAVVYVTARSIRGEPTTLD